MLLCSDALFVAKVIGVSAGEEYPAFGCCVPLRHLLTSLCQFDILQSGPGRGPNAIRSTTSTGVHHAARRRGCRMAARGARAADGDAASWRTEFWHATVGRTVTLAKCAGCSLNLANCVI